MRCTFLLLTLAACSSPAGDDGTATSAIQGGEPTTSDPAVGLLDLGAGHCTATLIAPNVVLTAGHCIGVPARMTFETNGVRRAVAEVLEHPDYDFFGETGCPTRTPDVGLVRLAQPIAEIAPLPWSSELPAVGATCRATGFGAHLTDAGVTETKKKRTATSVVETADSKHIRVRWGTGIADQGDSGGPLLCGDAVVGVVSCHPDEETHLTEYYQSLGGVTEWLRETVARWTADAPASP